MRPGEKVVYRTESEPPKPRRKSAKKLPPRIPGPDGKRYWWVNCHRIPSDPKKIGWCKVCHCAYALCHMRGPHVCDECYGVYLDLLSKRIFGEDAGLPGCNSSYIAMMRASDKARATNPIHLGDMHRSI